MLKNILISLFFSKILKFKYLLLIIFGFKTFIFDDLVQNFDLKKFIKLLDIECKYKTTYPLFDYKKPPNLYDDLITSCVNKNMNLFFIDSV